MNLDLETNLFLIISVLVLGIFLLIKGADWLIESASDLAKRFKVSDLLIGLLVVSVGTSLPELIVSLFANSQNSSEIAISNVLGSNIANILLVLGLALVFSSKSIKIPQSLLKKEILISLLVIVLLWFLVYFDPSSSTGLSVIDAMILSLGFLFFVVSSFFNSKETETEIQTEQGKKQNLFKLILFLVLGTVLLNLGGKLTVDFSVKLANYFELSKELIGLTIVALGTSLPELVATIVSSLKNKSEMALGNIIGSNIFNILFVLGITSLFNFVEFRPTNYPDLYMAGFASLLLIACALLFNQKRTLSKVHGALFLFLYFAFIAFRIWG